MLSGRVDGSIVSRPITLEDRWSEQAPDALMSGVQAVVRALLDQRRDDERHGVSSGGFASGYPGSPLGGLDLELQRRQADLKALGIVFQPGLNEELAATAVWGSQLAHLQRSARVDGVLGMWFGKSPGLDRAADALRHANLSGVGPCSGAIAVVGDDPACKSSTLPSASERTLSGLTMPVLCPASVQDVLDLGRHALRLSRAAGLWCALKLAADVADASATVAHRGHWEPVERLVEHTPTARLLGAPVLEVERSLLELRLPAALTYAREHCLNPTVVSGERDEIGLIAGGSTYAELRRALQDLGLDERALRELGVRLLKIGMLWPLDREAVRDFALGLDSVFVIEDKLELLETEVQAALYGARGLGAKGPPQVLGKRDAEGMPLLALHGALRADEIALALGRVLGERLRSHGQAQERLRRLSALHLPDPLPVTRTPFFCSGCPHSTSTVAQRGALVGAGIGCHVMLVQGSRQRDAAGSPERAGEIVGLTQMGGEGSQWIGISPFVSVGHFTQNIGDGTFHHSGSLALRAAIAAKVDVTYKLLYNGSVAMTGGQRVEGSMSVPDLARLLHAEGVAQIAITTDQPRRYRRLRVGPVRLGRVPLAPGTKVYDRSQLAEVERELKTISGVTVIIYDQGCAAEQRRLRRRGSLPQPTERLWINERVCEGCGDCVTSSACLSLEQVQTELGRKTRVHQASCNVDMSCLRGDCPSFVTVRPRREDAWSGRHLRRGSDSRRSDRGYGSDSRRGDAQLKDELRRPPEELPSPDGWSSDEPPTGLAEQSRTVRMVGIGGTGVVTASQVLAMAAHLQGLPAAVLDQTGLSQKGGPVVSDVQIGEVADSAATPHATRRSVDLLLGFDLLGTADPRLLAACDPDRTIAVISTTEVPAGEMALHSDVSFPEGGALLGRIERAAAAMPVVADARQIAERAGGEDIQANVVLLGAAWQLGVLPISLRALRRAVELNGATVEHNLIALDWGRAIVAAPEAAQRLVESPMKSGSAAGRASARASAAAITEALAEVRLRELPGEVHELVARRLSDLLAYGGRRLTARYLDEIEQVARLEAKRTNGRWQLTESAARQLHRLLAYKDEYEVARLHLLPEERERRERDFGQGARWWLNLHPPLLRAIGVKRKIRLGRWSLPLLYALRAGRRLRGTPLDLFGYSRVRRVERALPSEYLALLWQALELLDDASYAKVLEISEQAEQIRGYEQVKLANVEAWRETSAALLDRLRLLRSA